MKHTYAFLAAMLLVGASAFPLSFSNDVDEPNELDRDFEDFYRLIPTEELLRVIQDHLDDPELSDALLYLNSNDFHKLVYAAEDLPEFHKYVLYLQASGYNAIRELRNIHKDLGMKEYVPPKPLTNEVMANSKKGGGLDGYIDDVIAILPKKELQELHAKKVKESPAFAKFSAAVSSPKFAEIAAALYEQKPMQTLIREAKANTFDLEKYYIFKYKLYGFAV